MMLDDELHHPNIVTKAILNWRGDALYAGRVLVGWVERRDPDQNYDDCYGATVAKPWIVAHPAQIWDCFATDADAKTALVNSMINLIERTDD